jgi:acetyl-CoA carboxylase biotin carboxylase subunit
VFRKVLVANRGEIALRIIRACHAVGARAVAVYSEADRQSPHLAHADETVCIGPGPAAQSYLNADALLEAAISTECQAIHPGFGFLSENARFAARCEQVRLRFVGPRPSSMRMMGDKATARRTMAAAGVPILPGSRETLPSVEAALEMADRVGYPVLLKATAGGGGRGMRRVDAAAELRGAFEAASREAEKAFGDGGLYMEKYVVGGRHIEFQVLADTYGKVIHLGERECSVQRNHQKLIEEAPGNRISEALRSGMGERIVTALEAIGYQNAGTVELLMDADERLYFMEMNTRIQVEHPVTEMITGVDLVAWQLRIAAGQRLSLAQQDVRASGHAIECRINAEDPTQGFRPSPGTVTHMEPPPDAGTRHVRIDSHVVSGYRIPPNYDSMVGKLIVWDETRPLAVTRMQRALEQTRVDGVATTIPLHRAILEHPAFVSGHYHTGFLADHPEVFARAAAIAAESPAG